MGVGIGLPSVTTMWWYSGKGLASFWAPWLRHLVGGRGGLAAFGSVHHIRFFRPR